MSQNQEIKTISALDVAHYLLSLDPQRKYFTKRDGNFRLNTLLHILQILHYVKFDQLLFHEDLIAVSPAFWEDKQTQRKFLKRHSKSEQSLNNEQTNS
ncbi:MAG: hypothetical protein mread185_000211 [Mycoplasmataceae bacterium]|nr:MAG: hypothetical protein mread185_000211 [Mycoplasmataceae bacterium]